MKDPEFDDDEFEDDDEPRVYYQVDITIKPTASSTSMTHWEPGELILVPKAVKSDAEIWDKLEEAGYVETVEVFDGEQFVEDEDYKYAGAQRVRLLMSVQADCRQGRLQYYFEDLGGLELPLPAVSPATLGHISGVLPHLTSPRPTHPLMPVALPPRAYSKAAIASAAFQSV